MPRSNRHVRSLSESACDPDFSQTAGSHSADSLSASYDPSLVHAQLRPRAHPGYRYMTHILVAENDLYHRRVLKLLLASPMVKIMEVENGEAAIDVLSMRRFDLLLLDTRMDLMDGLETLSWLRSNKTAWADIPVIGLIDDDDRHLRPRLTALGMNAWVRKPLSRIDLRRSLLDFLPGLQDTSI
ncbi:MAG: response regulator [Hyphomonadaceae bacterium]